jgi:hypothetical protein
MRSRHKSDVSHTFIHADTYTQVIHVESVAGIEKFEKLIIKDVINMQKEVRVRETIRVCKSVMKY